MQVSSFHSVIERHAEMLFDLERTVPLLRAIRKKVRRGDVVVDLGCGLGILSMAAIHAGAKRVYAIDIDSEAIDFGKWQAKKLGMEKKICWLNDYSYNIDLMEKADLLIQETIGPLGFDENFLPTLQDAKKRFLKRRARIIPEEVSLWAAPVAKDKTLLQKPIPLIQFKIKTPSPFPLPRGERVRERVKIHIKKIWKGCEGSAGLLVWPKVIWAKGLETNCSPLNPPTHWRQTFFPQGAWHPMGKNKKGAAPFWLKIAPDPKDPWHLSEVLWKIFY